MLKILTTAMAALMLSLVPAGAGTGAGALVAPPDDLRVDDTAILDLLGAFGDGPCESCRASCLLGSCEACCRNPLVAVCVCELQGLLPNCSCQ